MPADLYGGVGVDFAPMYTSSLDMHQFSEPEWTSENIAPQPAIDYTHQNSFPSPAEARPLPIEVSAVPQHLVNVPRPKSSPSTFGPNVEDLTFHENPFKLDQGYFPSPQPSRTASPFIGQQYGGSSRSSPARQMPVAIAPDPEGIRQLQSMKRLREDDDSEGGAQQRKRKRAVSSTGPVELNDEETLLLKLKEEENLPWKDIAARFQTELGKTYQVPALQMRFKRLRERMRNWSQNDRSKRPANAGRNAVSPLHQQQPVPQQHQHQQLRTVSSAPPAVVSAPVTMPSPSRSYTPTGIPMMATTAATAASMYRPMPPHTSAGMPTYASAGPGLYSHFPSPGPIASPYHAGPMHHAAAYAGHPHHQPLSLPPTSLAPPAYPTHGAPASQAPWASC